MQRALREHPIKRFHEPSTNGKPQVTFIIGHRGESRLPHLLNTVATIAAQVGVAVECIVVEQDSKSVLSGRLPSWVKFVHSVPPTSDMPYCRSWAFNVGAGLASAEVLVLHDNDMLIPQDYAENIHKRVTQGAEVLNLKRFIFYCTERHTAAIFEKTADLTDIAPETVVQNLEGGGSVAITREAFERIGGMDESFIGWGGEDNEFWERAQTCRVWPYGYLPLVHLWHPSQPKKQEVDNPNLLRSLLLSAIPAGERISRLRSISRGAISGPAGFAAACLDHASAGHDARQVVV